MSVRRVPDMIGRKRLWKLESWASGALAAFLAQLLIKAAYRMVRKDKDKAPSAVFDPGSSRFSWGEAALWAVAGGIGLATAKMISNRLAAVGWEFATGTPPPGAEEQADG